MPRFTDADNCGFCWKELLDHFLSPGPSLSWRWLWRLWLLPWLLTVIIIVGNSPRPFGCHERDRKTKGYNDIVVRQVKQTIAKYGMLDSGDRVAVAVSGGPDSVALLECLRELAPQLGITLAVVHVNHQLRGRESDEDEQFVARLARRHRLEFLSKTVDIAVQARERGENTEQLGRTFRYEFFSELVRRGQFDKVAVGHTLSDQAETVLFRMLRGSGTAGLSGIRPVLDKKVVRPMIEVTRQQVIEYLIAGGHEWRADSSNQDRKFVRNRIRHELLPRLSEDWNPNLSRALAQIAEWAQGEENYWQGVLPALAESHLESKSDGVYFQAAAMTALPVAAARRLLRVAVERARGSLAGISFEHIEALRRLAAGRRGSGRSHIPDLEAIRSFDQIRLARFSLEPESHSPTQCILLRAPGSFKLPWGSSLVVLKRFTRENLQGKGRYNGRRHGLIDWEKVPKPLELRNWRAGDRFHPQGWKRAKKLKALFQERKIAVWERTHWPVIAAASGEAGRPEAELGERKVIVWARGFGPSVEFAADDNSRIVVDITEFASGGESEIGIESRT